MVHMIFLYIILSAVLLCYALSYAIRDGFIESVTNKEEFNDFAKK